MTIKIYTNTSSASVRKAKEWLVHHQLDFEEINWRREGMSVKEFYQILSLTDNGTDDIISKRSTAYPMFVSQVHHLSVKDVFIWLNIERSLLRLPIIIDDSRIQIGYDSDSIRKFLPRSIREASLSQFYLG